MPLSKKQIAVILAMKKKGKLFDKSAPQQPHPPQPQQPATPPVPGQLGKVELPKPPRVAKFPKLRLKLGF